MRPILAEGFKLSKVELLLNQPFIYYWLPINHLQGRLNDRPGLLRRGNLLFGAAADVDGIQQRERLILEAEHGFLHPSQRSRGHVFNGIQPIPLWFTVTPRTHAAL